MANILKTDEAFFIKEMAHTEPTHYFKTKDNSLRIAFFKNMEFVAIETAMVENVFTLTVLDRDTTYELKDKRQEFNTDGSLKRTIYKGFIHKD